jgi:hypothetical protein
MVVLGLGAVNPVHAQTAPGSDPVDICADVIVYVVRGSGEAPQPSADNPRPSVGEAWDAFDPLDPVTGGSSIDAGRVLDVGSDGTPTVATGTPFLYDLVQKIRQRVGGQVRLSWAPIQYRAIPVDTGNLPSKSLWALQGYPSSVTSGIRELHRSLSRQWELCGTRTRYVLAGYSQGADVVNSYLRGKIFTRSSQFGLFTNTEYLGPSPEIQQQIAAVALIADPNHDPDDPESYTNVDPAMAAKGGLNGRRRGIPEPMTGVTDSICLPGDPVCGQGFTIRPELAKGEVIHTKAYRDGVTYPVICPSDNPEKPLESAITCMADRVIWRLGLRNLVKEPLDESTAVPGTTGRDVAFFLDTTGSMSEDIDGAIRFAGEQAGRIIALDGRVALVQYRDANDAIVAEVVTPFTKDVTTFQAGLAALSADGGGDDPEALLHALTHGFNELDWQLGASKAAVVLTDATFHEPDPVGGETLASVERRSLEIDPVNVFPVVDDPAAYEALAARTSGEVVDKGSGDTAVALTSALDRIAQRPVAVLNNASYVASAEGIVSFDASQSSAAEGAVGEYRWDFDGDGTEDEVTTTPVVSHAYPAGYSGLMQMWVVDGSGRSGNASASVLVQEAVAVGPVPEVPSAASMSVDARAGGDHVVLTTIWESAGAPPHQWVVEVDGDPVAIASGESVRARVAVPAQPDRWSVSLTPMDAEGNYGTVLRADLTPVGRPIEWYGHWRVLLAAGGGAALVLLVAACMAVLRRKRKRGRSSVLRVAVTVGLTLVAAAAGAGLAALGPASLPMHATASGVVVAENPERPPGDQVADGEQGEPTVTPSSEASPTEPDPASSSLTCWDGSRAPTREACSLPAGRVGLATIFPELGEDCTAIPPTVEGVEEVYECARPGIVIRYSRWTRGADRYAYYDNALLVDGQEWRVGDQFAGRRWTTRLTDSDQPWRWTAVYRYYPYAVTVQATDKRLRDVTVSALVTAPPDSIGLRGSE